MKKLEKKSEEGVKVVQSQTSMREKTPQLKLIERIRNSLLTAMNSHEHIPIEDEIKRNYIELPNKKITLLCAHTTRLEGFLDILLTRKIISSREANLLFGKVQTHRGDSMTFGQKRNTNYFGQNDYISFSTGFVSFKYSDSSIRSRNDYLGGYGFFIPLQSVLQYSRLGFSHCSRAGGIEDYNLNKDNIVSSTHKARKSGELLDDGYGNVFEVRFESLHDNTSSSSFKRVLEYPQIPISHGIIAIPLSEKEKIGKLLVERQEMYRKLLDDINKISDKKITEWQNIGGRDLLNPEKTREYLLEMLEPIDLNNFPIFWYEQKNLDIALLYLSQK